MFSLGGPTLKKSKIWGVLNQRHFKIIVLRPNFLDSRFYFSWPRATMLKSDPLALKLAKIEEEKAKSAKQDGDKAKKAQRPPLSFFNFHPASAQVRINQCGQGSIS